MRFGELVIDTLVCLTLAKWETVFGQFGGYLNSSQPGTLVPEDANPFCGDPRTATKCQTVPVPNRKLCQDRREDQKPKIYVPGTQ